MGYYTEVQTANNTMAVPLDSQGNIAQVDEDGQAVIQRSNQKNIKNAPSDLVSNDSSLPRKDAVDLSSYQSWMTQRDFNQLKVQGIKTVIIKLTESTNYINPAAKTQIQMAQKAGLQIAVYHFSHFSESDKASQATANNTAIAEAKFFSSVAKKYGLPSSTVLINDAEYVPANSVGTLPLWDWTIASQKFTAQLKKQGFATVRHYTSQSWAVDNTGQMEPSKLGAKNLWIAQYLFGKPSAADLKNTQFGAWQYTSQMYFVNFSKHSPVDVTIDYANMFTPVTPTPTPTNYKNVYRLYNTKSKEHLFTTDENEKNVLPKNSKYWKYETVAWKSPQKSNSPVYRVYNPRSGEHLYTMDKNEVNVLVSRNHWKAEGISFYSDSTSKTPAYRLYNAAAGIGSHFITMDTNEKNVLSNRGWKYEGIAWYGEK